MSLDKKNFSSTATVLKYALNGLLCAFVLMGCDKKPIVRIPGEGAFATVPESAIAGRYKWIENGTEFGVATLAEDHSVTSWNGEKKKSYKWELQKEGLLLIWAKGFNFFPNVVEPEFMKAGRTASRFGL